MRSVQVCSDDVLAPADQSVPPIYFIGIVLSPGVSIGAVPSGDFKILRHITVFYSILSTGDH